MAGIYVHIPFCKQRCYYCDFHSSTYLKNSDDLLSAIKKEIEQEKEYLTGEVINTIYLGGGTPSLIAISKIKDLIDHIKNFHTVLADAEITMECNPDDLTEDYIQALANSPINRLSIGVQSFDDTQLQKMNRRHTGDQAKEVVEMCQAQGFSNISIDLIYGMPGMNLPQWERTVKQALELEVQHISAYHLTIEEGTVFAHQKNKGMLREIDETLSNDQFQLLIEYCKNANFEHYEISNFALSGYYSKHNTAYWQQTNYLGLGPSAHSYNGTSRHWNIAHNKRYIAGIKQNQPNREHEILDPVSKYNEYLMTSLRTVWGVDLGYMKKKFPEAWVCEFQQQAKVYVEGGVFEKNTCGYTFSEKGLFISDKIISDLFRV